MLVEAGAKVNEEVTTALPLQMAAMMNSLDCMEYLVKAGANVNIQSKNGGISALMDASSKGHTEAVAWLLENEAEVDLRDVTGLTALMYASYRGKTDVVRQLIGAGADVNLRGLRPHVANTPLLFAVLHRHEETAIEILRAKPVIAEGDKECVKRFFGGRIPCV